jgi:hypothetical protein
LLVYVRLSNLGGGVKCSENRIMIRGCSDIAIVHFYGEARLNADEMKINYFVSKMYKYSRPYYVFALSGTHA